MDFLCNPIARVWPHEITWKSLASTWAQSQDTWTHPDVFRLPNVKYRITPDIPTALDGDVQLQAKWSTTTGADGCRIFSLWLVLFLSKNPLHASWCYAWCAIGYQGSWRQGCQRFCSPPHCTWMTSLWLLRIPLSRWSLCSIASLPSGVYGDMQCYCPLWIPTSSISGINPRTWEHGDHRNWPWQDTVYCYSGVVMSWHHNHYCVTTQKTTNDAGM